MSRSAIVTIVLVIIAAGVSALYIYSRSVMGGISMGGPVPLQSVPPRPAKAAPAQRTHTEPPSPAATAAPSARSTSPNLRASAPQIFSASLNAPVATGGQIVTGTVQTSPDVTSVLAEIMGYSTQLSRVSAGYFALSYRVPTLPTILRRTYTIVVIARNAAGLTATSSLPITIR